MVTKKFFRGTFESSITTTTIIINNNNSSSNRSSNNHNSNSSDISINSLILPPGGFEGPQQTFFGQTAVWFGNLLFRARKSTHQMTKKILITFLFFFFIDHELIFTFF